MSQFKDANGNVVPYSTLANPLPVTLGGSGSGAGTPGEAHLGSVSGTILNAVQALPARPANTTPYAANVAYNIAPLSITAAGAKTLTPTNSQLWVDPATVPFTAVASASANASLVLGNAGLDLGMRIGV